MRSLYNQTSLKSDCRCFIYSLQKVQQKYVDILPFCMARREHTLASCLSPKEKENFLGLLHEKTVETRSWGPGQTPTEAESQGPFLLTLHFREMVLNPQERHSLDTKLARGVCFTFKKRQRMSFWRKYWKKKERRWSLSFFTREVLIFLICIYPNVCLIRVISASVWNYWRNLS